MALTGTFGNLTYTTSGDNATITGLSETFTGGELVIPASITGEDGKPYTVTAFTTSAFQGQTSITSVDMSQATGVSTIPQTLFYQCSNMTSISLPTSITTFGMAAFRETGLTSIDLSGTKAQNLAQRLFQDCKSLEQIKLPSDLKSIDSWALCGTGIKSLDLSGLQSLTSIQSAAFQNSTQLSEIKFPQTLNSIGESSPFSGTAIETLDFSETSITDAVKTSYTGMSQLKHISYPATLKNLGKNGLQSDLFNGISSIETVDMSRCTQIEDIPANTFKNTTSLQSVLLPVSVGKLGNDCFNGSNIPSIDLSHVQAVGDNCFNKSGLTTVELPDGFYLGSQSFTGCTKLTSASMGKGIKLLPATFSGCTALSEVVLPEDLKEIPGGTSQSTGCFSGCTSLKQIDIPASCATLGSYCFYNTGLTSVIIPDACTEIGSSAFQSCSSLAQVDFNKVETIGTNAFNGCTSLTDPVFPPTLTDIGNNAFRACTNLGTVTIPAGVSSIGTYAFYNGGITDLTIEGGHVGGQYADNQPETAALTIGSSAFAGGSNAMTVTSFRPVPPTAVNGIFNLNTYNNGKLYLTGYLASDDDVKNAYATAPGWSSFKSQNIQTGVEDIAAEGVSIEVTGRTISVSGAKACIYNAAGTQVFSGKADSVTLGKGLYIIVAGDKTVKAAL